MLPSVTVAQHESLEKITMGFQKYCTMVTGILGLGRTALTSAIKGTSKGSIFFLHGTCDSGPGLKSWVNKTLKSEFKFDHYRVLYPSAPTRPYQLMNGQDAAVWYDRISPGPNMPEDQVSINQVGNQLNKLILEEQSNGKVIVGGFSIGGSMALHLAYRFNPKVAGVFALSSFLPEDSSVFTSLDAFVKENPQTEPEDDIGRKVTKNGHLLDKPKPTVSEHKLPKLFMSRGIEDPLVRPRWSESTFKRIRSYGIDGHLFTFPNQSHEINRQQLNVLHTWIEETLADGPKPKITREKPYHANDNYSVPVPDSWLKRSLMAQAETRDKSCWACRIVGGGGLLGAGIYVASQVPKQGSPLAKVVVSTFAGGLAYIGSARLLGLPPFKEESLK